MFFNRTTVLIFCIAICTIASAQSKQANVKFGDVKPEDFKPAYYDVDSSADAVYLVNIGSARYDFSGNQFAVFYTVHSRIRLLHKKSFDDLATIKMSFSKIGNDDYIKDFQAATYTNENGKVVITKVDKNSLFKDKDGTNEIMKFTFPNLQEGCIIEYTYTKVMTYANLPRWSFQSDYPELWNEYTVEIPEYLDFVVLQRGYLIPVVDTVSKSFESYFNSDVVKHTWAYKDIPALKDESYVTSLSNYRQSMQFQLSALRVPGQDTRYFMHTWPETIEQLIKDDDFGADLNKENGWLKEDIKKAIDDETDPVEKAKKIYEFVRDNYTCIDHSAIYLSQTLKKTQQLKKGSVVDINMLLVAMLGVAGYDADPVLLSTREHGETFDIYPILDKFNYLIARVAINDSTYYLLDAAEPQLGFGHLTEECYNGNARVISPNPVLINLAADSLHESEITTLFLSNDEKGMSGSYKSVMGEMQSQRMREKMEKMNADEYFKDVKKSYLFDVTINDAAIDSLKQLEMPISVQYSLSFKPEDDILYFTPVLTNAYRENPFNAAQRFYPVEMPYCIDKTYILNMEVPAGYKVDELPKPARVSLNDTEGMFEYLIQQGGDHIQLRCRLVLNKATFEPDDYETLRNFFAFVVEKEGEQIVFKKQ